MAARWIRGGGVDPRRDGSAAAGWHYRFEPRPVAPARGDQKGRVERVIRYLRERFFAGPPGSRSCDLVGDFAALKGDTFVSYDGGVYPVDSNSLAKGKAYSDHSDPYTDYDGDPRPRSEGALEYAGTDRPPS